MPVINIDKSVIKSHRESRIDIDKFSNKGSVDFNSTRFNSMIKSKQNFYKK